jgi:rRNA biogenesis protein RRP5
LGMITKINELDLVVALPNHMTGKVPITEISDAITRRVEAAALDEESEQDEPMPDVDEEVDDEDLVAAATRLERGLPDLRQLFSVGQWVRCAVVGLPDNDESTTGDAKAKSRRKRHIELSLKVEHVNAGLATLDLIAGLTLTAAVESVEDHGYLLSFGIRDKTAFLLRKDAQEYEKMMNRGQPLQSGQLIDVMLLEAAGSDRNRVRQVRLTEPLSNINSLLPGELVTARITRILPNGLACRILEFFDAVVHVAHLSDMLVASEQRLRDAFKVGDKITGRVLYVSLSVVHKAIGLSMLPHVVGYKTPQVEGLPPAVNDMELGPRYGAFIERVTVRQVDNGMSLLCEIDQLPGVFGRVHVSRRDEQST